jgi:hypothetical protein
MTNFGWTLSRSALPSFLGLGALPAGTLTNDLSRYRNFRLGTDLPAVAKQAGANPSQAKTLHRRPALIQELEWRPQPPGSSSQKDAAQEVVLSFYNGQLFRIAIDYDRSETEGMTPDDLVEAISAAYGIAARPAAPAKAASRHYDDQEEILAQWQDSLYRFDLIRSSYGPTFKLVGILKKLETPAQAAIIEAARLDDQEAPQREADRIAKEDETERARLEKARLVNKPKFRP